MGTTIAPVTGFDYYAFFNGTCTFMESVAPPTEWLNYHHLRYFHAVAKAGSITAAAELLHTSPSALCAQVKQLEASLGETLYRRAGRRIELTEFGRTILGYAEEIFALGHEILSTARRAPTRRALRLSVGIVDSFPKLLTLDVLRPLFTHEPPIQISCREGKLDDLLGQLAAHRLDAILADEPPPSSASVKTFDHPLGSSGITFCAAPALARRLRGRFPRNLHGAPVLLPAQTTALRRDVEKWFRQAGVEPVLAGEFEDAALAKIIATEEVGVTLVPTVVVAEAIERYGFVALGRTTACSVQLHLITAERRIEHPGVARLARAIQVRRRKGR
jgi:LysR family transcriptional activator of nhaA